MGNINERLSQLKKFELATLARKLQLTGYSGKNKSDLIDHIIDNASEQQITAALSTSDSQQPAMAPAQPSLYKKLIMFILTVIGLIGSIASILGYIQRDKPLKIPVQIEQGEPLFNKLISDIDLRLQSPLKKWELTVDLSEYWQLKKVNIKDLAAKLNLDRPYSDHHMYIYTLSNMPKNSHMAPRSAPPPPMFENIPYYIIPIMVLAFFSIFIGRIRRSAKGFFEKANAIRHFNKGNAMSALGRMDQALMEYEKAVKIRPDDASAWNNIGAALSALGREEETFQAFEKAIRIKPDYADAWYNIGVTLNGFKRHDEAVNAYNKATKINPNFHQAWCNKGILLYNLNRKDEAIQAFNKAIEIKSDNSSAWSNKGVALSALGRNDEAIHAYSEAIRINPTDHSSMSSKGLVLAQIGKYDEALQCVKKAVDINPSSESAWYNLACVYSVREDKANALKYLKIAIEKGFREVSHIGRDPAFNFIRNEPEFQKIIAGLEGN